MPKPPRGPYCQRLPALSLSIERGTDSVPDDNHFYLVRAGETIGRFKTLQAAQDAWRDVVAESSWEPPKQERDPRELLVRETTMRENERFFEYWGSSHKFRS